MGWQGKPSRFSTFAEKLFVCFLCAISSCVMCIKQWKGSMSTIPWPEHEKVASCSTLSKLPGVIMYLLPAMEREGKREREVWEKTCCGYKTVWVQLHLWEELHFHTDSCNLPDRILCRRRSRGGRLTSLVASFVRCFGFFQISRSLFFFKTSLKHCIVKQKVRCFKRCFRPGPTHTWYL